MVRRMTLWVTLVLVGAGCDDGSAPGAGDMGAGDARPTVDRGGPFDMRPLVDMALDDDMTARDMTPADVMPPDDMAADGMPPDMALPDVALPDMTSPDMAPPDMAPPVAGAGLTAGAARVSSPRFTLSVSVGGPSPTAHTTSPRFRARLGVGALSIPTPAEDP